MKFSLIILILFSGAILSLAQSSRWLDSDYQKLVSCADLIYQQPVSRSEAGQPVGNGRMGSLVWTIPSQVKMQVNRVDIFASNSATNNFFERNTDYCGSAAFVDFDFGEEVFVEPDFRQHLSCYDGLVKVRGKSVNMDLLAWNEQDVMAARVSDQRKRSLPVFINLRMLRMPVSKKGNHTAISKISTFEGNIVLTQEFREDDYYCGSAVVIDVSGTGARAELTDESTVRLVTEPGAGQFSVLIASAAGFDPQKDLVTEATGKLQDAKSKTFDGLYQSNQQWWSDFWSQSFIRLSSPDGVADFIEQNYTYYLYVMASSSRGNYPVKFNGMLWTTGGDRRQWGSAYWGANQSCLYNALFSTNHPELMDPMFNMYSSAYGSFGTAARQQWGSKGIYIPETVGFDGVPELPEDIAGEMRALYLLQKPWEQRSKGFMDYAENKQPFLSRWNWKYTGQWIDGRFIFKERGDGPNGPVNHIFSRSAKIAYQYWQKYEYTCDLNWLKEKAYPILKGVAEFYRNYPNIQKGADGKYHIYHVNDNESIWGGHNTVEEISAMMGIFSVVIRASEILKLDHEMRPVWKEFLANLSPLPTSRAYPDMADSSEFWVGSLQPESKVRGNGQRPPDGNTMPVWFFDLCNPGGDPDRLKIARSTFNRYFKDGISKDSYPYVLSKIPAAGAILERADAVRFLLPNQIRRSPKDEVLPNRMDLSEGFYTTNIQRLGRAADALQLALVQSLPPAPGEEPVIRVFPAWPREWNAQFSLLCRGNFLVTSSMNQGAISFVKVKSQAGQVCRLINPWGKRNIDIFKNGKKLKTTNQEHLSFKTNTGDHFILLPEGGSLGRNNTN
ncbi:MAG: glycoside hydrolase family 95-like protein [Mangrovibacterium sp.]